jgi:hypothetical protein
VLLQVLRPELSPTNTITHKIQQNPKVLKEGVRRSGNARRRGREGSAYRNAKKGVSPRLGPPAFLRLAPVALNLHRRNKSHAPRRAGISRYPLQATYESRTGRGRAGGRRTYEVSVPALAFMAARG